MVKTVFRMFVLLGVLAFGASFASANSPANGTTAAPRGAPVDGDNLPFFALDNVGWKVWVTTSTNEAQRVRDEDGNLAVAGIVKQVCVSTGAITEYAAVLDTTTTAGITLTSIVAANVISAQILPQVIRTTTAQVCSAANYAQFQNGLVLFQSAGAASGQAFVYWRPAKLKGK